MVFVDTGVLALGVKQWRLLLPAKVHSSGGLAAKNSTHSPLLCKGRGPPSWVKRSCAPPCVALGTVEFLDLGFLVPALPSAEEANVLASSFFFQAVHVVLFLADGTYWAVNAKTLRNLWLDHSREVVPSVWAKEHKDIEAGGVGNDLYAGSHVYRDLGYFTSIDKSQLPNMFLDSPQHGKAASVARGGVSLDLDCLSFGHLRFLSVRSKDQANPFTSAQKKRRLGSSALVGRQRNVWGVGSRRKLIPLCLEDWQALVAQMQEARG